MESGYVPRNAGSDIAQYNQRVNESPGYKNRVDFTTQYLRDQLFLTEDEIESLGIEERFRRLPFRLIVGLTVRSLSSKFKNRHGVNYTDIDAGKLADEILDFEYGRVPREEMKPVHHEYVSMWAEELEKLFGKIKANKRQFPSEAYPKTEDPVYQEKEPTLQEQIDRLLEGS